MVGTISDGSTNIGPTGAAIGFVQEGWDFFEDKATLFSNRALGIIDQLSYVPRVEPVSFTVSFPDITGLTAFDAPDRPLLPTIEPREIAVPEAPDAVAQVQPPGFAEAPAFDVDKPLPISLPRQPGQATIADPGDAPTLRDLVVPDAPLMPDRPALVAIDIPLLETLPSYDVRAPGLAPVLPSLTGAGFTEQPYTPALLGELTPKIRQGLASGTILDASIEAALFQRARDRSHAPRLQAMQEVDEEFSSRGFKLMPGQWAARRDAERRRTEDALADTNRELTIQFHQEAIKNVQFAVVQGIALEQVLIGQHSAMMDRALQASRLMLDTHVALYNAEVAGYNAEIERLKAESGVFVERLSAAIEAFKAKIEGQRANADQNRALAEVFRAEVSAIAEQYRATVDGVRAQADNERSRIEGYRASVEAFGQRLRGQEIEWDGYRSAIEAQTASFRGYEIGVNAYAARVNAWGEGERAKSARYDTQLRGATATLDAYRARIQGVLARLQGEDGRINALARQSEAIARMYQADGQIAMASNDANTRAFQAAVSYAETRANVQLKEAEIKIQDASRLLTAQVEAIRGAAQALSQLAASAMSAVNFSAGVSGSGSESSSFSYSMSKSVGWSWSGETADNNDPPIF